MLRGKTIKPFLLYSLLFHLFVLSILVISFEWSSPPPVLENSNQTVPAINAEIVSAPFSHPSAVKKVQKTSQKVIEKAVKKTKTLAIDSHKKLQHQIEKQLAAEMKERADLLKKNKQKMLEQAFAKELQSLNEKNNSAKKEKSQGVVDKYKALILQAISHHWLVPPNTDKNLSTQLLIRLSPGGMVLDVQLVKSSGNENLDRSARAAVFKASPLPVPENADEFGSFKEFILKVKPENIINTG